MTSEKKTFREAYGVLQLHAETLRNQTEPNIDDLLSIVEESVSAYRVCKERIDAVEKALEKALNDVEDVEPRAGSESVATRPNLASRKVTAAPARAPAADQEGSDFEDDIPF
jgi:exodeoxyribonuclease VII small subunit